MTLWFLPIRWFTYVCGCDLSQRHRSQCSICLQVYALILSQGTEELVLDAVRGLPLPSTAPESALLWPLAGLRAIHAGEVRSRIFRCALFDNCAVLLQVAVSPDITLASLRFCTTCLERRSLPPAVLAATLSAVCTVMCHPRAIEVVQSGAFALASIVTHVTGFADSPEAAIQLSAFDCIIALGSVFYSSLKPFMADLCRVTMTNVTAENRIAVRALEFWSTLCEVCVCVGHALPQS